MQKTTLALLATVLLSSCGTHQKKSESPATSQVLQIGSPGGKLVMNTIRQPSAPELRASGKPVMIEAWDHTAEEMAAAGEDGGFTLDRSQDFTFQNEVISTLQEWTLASPE